MTLLYLPLTILLYVSSTYTEDDVIVDYPTREDVYALNSAEKIGL